MERTTILNLLIQIFFLEVDKWTPARLKLVGQAFAADLFPLPEDILLKFSDGPVRADYLVCHPVSFLSHTFIAMDYTA